MACKPGDLVLIPFPFSDLQSAKKRPVMWAQPNHAMPIGATDLVEGALPKACWIRFDKVFTLSESSIVKTFGAVSPQTIQAVLQGLCSVVGYTRK